ncbi:MAG: c-type cytochrome [Aquificota bacterium]|nr:c-type cytochrome [Aquificota bacterium]
MRRKIAIAGALFAGALMLASCEKKETKEEKPKEEKAEVEKKEIPKSGAYALADSKGCLACHAMDRKKVGPSYVEIAKRYAGKGGAVEELVKSITKGSMGKWGSIPMTPQPVSEEEAKELAEWILSLK